MCISMKRVVVTSVKYPRYEDIITTKIFFFRVKNDKSFQDILIIP